MKNNFKFTALFLILNFLLIACNNNKQESLFEESFLIVTNKIVEKFDSGKLIDKNITNYFYDRQNDFFWYKSIVKDSSGKIIQTIDRKLDIRTRLPVRETIKENGKIVQSSKLKYSIDNYELLFKEEYIANTKLRSTHWKYDKEGYLISKADTLYDSKNKFANLNSNDIDSNRIKLIEIIDYLPSIAKPKGYYPMAGFVRFKKIFKTENNQRVVDTFQITKLDTLGYPLFDSLFEATGTTSKQETNWFKIVIDGGKIVSIIAYDDKDFKSVTAEKSQLEYNYNSDGLLEEIKDMRYNALSGEFDVFNSSQQFEWTIPKFKSRHNFADYNYASISNCYNSKTHTKYEKKIVRFDDVGKKVVEEYSGSFTGDCNGEKEIKTKLIKRTTYIYNKLEIKGETAVIYKNRKVEKNL